MPGLWLRLSAASVEYCNIYDNGVRNVYAYDCGPDLDYSWFCGASDEEIRFYSSGTTRYPCMEYSNIPTTDFPGSEGRGTADWAVYWESSSNVVLESDENWWGASSSTVEANWDSIINPPDMNSDFINYTTADSPSRNFAPRSTRRTEVSADVAVFQNAREAERNERRSDALTAYRSIISTYPGSEYALRSIERVFRVMTVEEPSKETFLNYFSGLASRTENPEPLRSAALEMHRRALVWFGEYDQAITAYRAVALDSTAGNSERRGAWLQVAFIAHYADNTELRDGAIAQVLKDGNDTPEARTVHEFWEDRATAYRPTDIVAQLPIEASLEAFPNPFNPTTTLRYSVPADGQMKISIYNIAGQHVRTLVDRNMTAGYYSVAWHGRDAMNRRVGSGVYVVRFTTPNRIITKRITMVY